MLLRPALIMLLLLGCLAIATPAAAKRNAQEVEAFLKKLTETLAAEPPPELASLQQHLPHLMKLLCSNDLSPEHRVQVAALIAQLGTDQHIVPLLEPMLFARSELDRTEIIRKWAVSDAFAHDPAKAITEQRFAPEQGGEVKWREITAPDDGVIDLATVNGARENALIYVRTHLHVDQAQPVRLGVRSDDGVEIFVNGQSVFVFDKPRGINPTPDTVDVLLNAGQNTIVYKVYNIAGPWLLAGQWTRMAQAEYDPDLHARALHAVADAVEQRKLHAAPNPKLLEALLERDHAELRRAAIRLVGLWRVEPLRPRIHHFAADGKHPAPLRQVAVDALGNLAGDTDRNALVSLTEASEPFLIRGQAVFALSRIDANVALERARHVLATAPEGDEACQAMLARLKAFVEPPAPPQPAVEAAPAPEKEPPAAEAAPTPDPAPQPAPGDAPADTPPANDPAVEEPAPADQPTGA